MDVHEALARAFHAEGTRAVFNIMGDGNKLWLVSMAAQPGVRLYNARHEGAALAMADGYSRACGQVGVASVTYATGVTQIATSLAVAAKHGTPLVVLAADTPDEQRGMGGQLDIDARALVRATGALAHEVRTPATAAEDVHLAFHRARTGSRPVVLLARSDLMESPFPSDARDAAPLWAPASRPRADTGQISAAADLIAACTKPIVLVGLGAGSPAARLAAVALAETSGALLATTLQAKGWFDADPFNLGLAGGLADDRTRHFFSESDCVITIGASLNQYTTAEDDLFPQARVVQIDTRPSGLINARRSADVYVQGDAEAAATAIAAQLNGHSGTVGWRTKDTARSLSTDPRPGAVRDAPADLAPGEMDPREMMMALDDILPDDAIVVTGVGHYTTFPVMYLRNPRDREFMTVYDFITIGQAISEGIGVSAARPERPVVVFEGDASLMMHVQELETAARCGVPILVFIINDGALGAEYHKLRALDLDASQTIMPTADICEVGTALGARTCRVTNLDELAQVGRWFDPARGPHVVDCPVSRTVRGPL